MCKHAEELGLMDLPVKMIGQNDVGNNLAILIYRDGTNATFFVDTTHIHENDWFRN